MTRVLHVLDQADEAGEALALKLSVDAVRLSAKQGNESDRHAWLLLGGESFCDAADAVGLDQRCYRLMPRPRGVSRYMPGAMRAIKQQLEQADTVRCWSKGAADLVGAMHLAHATSSAELAGLSTFAKDTIQASLSFTDEASPVVSRAQIRERWGVPDDAVMVALLSDRPSQVDASAALSATAYAYEALHASDQGRCDIRLLGHPLARRRVDASRLSDLLDQPQLFQQDACLLTPWRVLAGCDLAIAPDPSQAGLSILWADAMGLPTVVPAGDRLPLLDELEHILRARSHAPKHLAHELSGWVAARRPASAVLGS